jgi:hypothetical protein
MIEVVAERSRRGVGPAGLRQLFRPTADQGLALNHFTILFEGRVTNP